MKRISVLTVGSRGDIEPFIALSKELKAKGYQVRLITHRDFSSLAAEHDVEIVPIELSSHEFTTSFMTPPEVNLFTMVRTFRGILEPLLDSILPDMWQYAMDSDVIISSGTTLWGLDIAEKLQVPHILVGLQPLFPPGAFRTY